MPRARRNHAIEAKVAKRTRKAPEGAPVFAQESVNATSAPAEWADPRGLVPWRKNPRNNDKAVPRLIESMRRFGFGSPIVARRENREVIAGHSRLRAALQLGLDRVPVRFVDLSEEQAHAMALADNKLGEISKWDEAILSEVAHDLRDAGQDALLETAGFKLSDLFPTTAGAADEADAVLPTHPPVVTTFGDVWQLGDHRLVCGDSFDAATRAVAFAGMGEADVVLTDPPYAVFGSSSGLANDIADDKMIRPFFETMFKVVRQHTKKFGHIYVCCDWRSYATVWEAARRATERDSIVPKNCIVWDKGNSGLGANYANGHEFVAFLMKIPPRRFMRSADEVGQRGVNGVNIVRFNRTHGEDRLHNAAKPPEMFRLFIEKSSDPGQLIVDFFGGSGTTMIAAERTGRRSLTFEMEPPICDTAIARWERVTGKKATKIGTVEADAGDAVDAAADESLVSSPVKKPRKKTPKPGKTLVEVFAGEGETADEATG